MHKEQVRGATRGVLGHFPPLFCWFQQQQAMLLVWSFVFGEGTHLVGEWITRFWGIERLH